MRYENNSQSKIDKNFVEIIKLLNTHNIDYWLCHGTLLGIIRDNDLIKWDHDIDIAVWSNNTIKKKFSDIMIENNFILKEKYLVDDDLLTFIKEGGREVDINFYDKKFNGNSKVAYIKWLVPKNNIMKLIDALSSSDKYLGKGRFLINRLYFLQNFFKKVKIFFIKKRLFL